CVDSRNPIAASTDSIRLDWLPGSQFDEHSVGDIRTPIAKSGPDQASVGVDTHPSGNAAVGRQSLAFLTMPRIGVASRHPSSAHLKLLVPLLSPLHPSTMSTASRRRESKGLKG